MRFHLIDEHGKIVAMAEESGYLEIPHLEGTRTKLYDSKTGIYIKPMDALVQHGK